MKTRPILFLLLFALAIASACKKSSDEPEPTPPSLPKVQSQTFGDSSGQSTLTYAYDASGRLIRASLQSIPVFTITYGTGTVDVVEGVSGTGHFVTYHYVLNSAGLATSALIVSEQGDGPQYFQSWLRRAGLLADTATTTFTYDANGYLTKEIDTSNYGKETTTYVISGGNTVSETHESEGITVTVTYEYLTDKTNTIGQENMGIRFLGHQDKNLIAKMNAMSGSINFTYQYDSKGRVLKQSDDQGNFVSVTYTD